MSLRNKMISVFRRNFPVMWSKVHYKKLFHKKLNLKNPVNMNEKINWMKFYYCPYNELEIKCTDKYAVRSYVEEKGLKEILTHLYGVWDSADDINWNELPEKFAIKCNHGCAMNIICADKSILDIEEAKKKLNRWMKENFGRERAQPHYSTIKPKIICEEYIESKEGVFPDDYKIHCFNGEPKVIDVHTGRGKEHLVTCYDTEWNYLDYKCNPGERTEPPVCLYRLLDISRILSEDFPYVRVDLYIEDEKIIFGELTFTQGNGCVTDFTEKGNIEMGNMLDISSLMQ